MSDQSQLLAVSAAPELQLQPLKPQQQAQAPKEERPLNVEPIQTRSPEEEKEAFKVAIAELDKLVKPLSIGLNVQRIDSLDRFYVELFDRETGEVLREIPSKKIIELQENLKQFQGLMFDQLS